MQSVLRLEDEELAGLIQAGESCRVEFKSTLSSSKKAIREAVCAFSNDLTGSGQVGIVVVGLKDDGTHSDLEVTDELLRSLTDVRNDGHIVPVPSIQVEKRLYNGKELAVVTVLPSDSPPVRCDGKIQVRSGPRRSIASAQDEHILIERRRYGNRPYDISPLRGTGTVELNRRQFEDEYLPQAVDRQLLEENERSFTERLAATKMIASVDDERATVLGLLVLGVRPRDFIPGAYVQFLRIDGNELDAHIADEAEIDGTISDTLSQLEKKLRSHNRRALDFVGKDREYRAEQYPYLVLQQLVRNAVMHRSYETTNAPVRVYWFNNRIEIQNPGGPFGTVTKENFGKPGVTDYRNPNLAEAMKVLGYVQKFGAGIQIAQKRLRHAGHSEIDFTIEPSHILATVNARPSRDSQ